MVGTGLVGGTMPRFSFRVAAFLRLQLLVVLAATSLLAQTSETGLPPYGAFHGSETDVVSLENGNLHIEIPIHSVRQRAFPDLTYNFVYDIGSWQLDESETSPTTFQWGAFPAPHQLAGWHLLANQAGYWHVDHDTVPKSCTYLASGHQMTRNYNVYTTVSKSGQVCREGCIRGRKCHSQNSQTGPSTTREDQPPMRDMRRYSETARRQLRLRGNQMAHQSQRLEDLLNQVEINCDPTIGAQECVQFQLDCLALIHHKLPLTAVQSIATLSEYLQGSVPLTNVTNALVNCWAYLDQNHKNSPLAQPEVSAIRATIFPLKAQETPLERNIVDHLSFFLELVNNVEPHLNEEETLLRLHFGKCL
jgi:hypothetical protein